MHALHLAEQKPLTTDSINKHCCEPLKASLAPIFTAFPWYLHTNLVESKYTYVLVNI